MENKKQIIISVAVGILVVGLLIAVVFIGEKEPQSIKSEDPNVIIANAQKESSNITAREMKELENINMNKYLELYGKQEISIVFVGRPTCPYCEIAKPIISKISKDYNLKIYYLNTDEFTNDDNANFVRHNEMFNEGYGTPIVLVISNNKIINAIEGLTDTAHYIDFFKSNKLIK